MNRVWVKIEGLTRPADARRAAALGADAIGLVFAESPRRVTGPQAKAIVRALPLGTHSVALFVNSEVAEINRVVAGVKPTHVQLHGDEPPEIVRWIDARVIKAFRIRSRRWIDEVRHWLDGLLDINDVGGIVLDAYDAKKAGGTGKRFNWRWVADAHEAGALEGLPPIILAGGLTADCVADAIRTVRPWGIDVSSGVERTPGVKDFRKVRAFIDNAHGTRPPRRWLAMARWIRHGRRGKLLRFLDVHPELKTQRPWGPPPLYMAWLSKRRTQLVPLLLDHGVCINQRWGPEMTVLMIAAVMGDVAMVQLLIDRGADVDAVCAHEHTAFSFAVANDSPRVAKLIRAAGAEVNRPDLRGATALDWAKYLASPEMYAWMRSVHCVHRIEKPGWAGPNARCAQRYHDAP